MATQDDCAICGRPIDKELRTPHPMSAEVDEIVPFSLGGSPTDKGNVQLVHRICNQKKSNRIPRKASVPPESFGDEPSREW